MDGNDSCSPVGPSYGLSLQQLEPTGNPTISILLDTFGLIFSKLYYNVTVCSRFFGPIWFPYISAENVLNSISGNECQNMTPIFLKPLMGPKFRVFQKWPSAASLKRRFERRFVWPKSFHFAGIFFYYFDPVFGFFRLQQKAKHTENVCFWRQCHKIFDTFLSKKNSWAPNEQEKTFCEAIRKN